MDLPVYAPEDVNHPLWVDRIRDLQPDVIFSFYYRHMLSGRITLAGTAGRLQPARFAAAALPWRAPVNWALVNGETETGATLHKMVKRPDAGDIVGQQKVTIADSDTALTLHKKCWKPRRPY